MTASATRGTPGDTRVVFTGGGGAAQSNTPAVVLTCMEQSLKRILTSDSSTGTTTSTMPTRVSTQPITTHTPTSWTYTETHRRIQPETETGDIKLRLLDNSPWLPATTREERTRQWVEESTKRTAQDSIEDVKHLWTTQQGTNATGVVLAHRTNVEQPEAINNTISGISGMENFQKVNSDNVLSLGVGNVKLGEAPKHSQVGNQQGRTMTLPAGSLQGYPQNLYRHLMKSGAIRTSTKPSSTVVSHAVPGTSGQRLQQYPGQSISPTLQTQQHALSKYQPSTPQTQPHTSKYKPATLNTYQPTTSDYQPVAFKTEQPETSNNQDVISPQQPSNSHLHHTALHSLGPTLVSSSVSKALRTMHGEVTNALPADIPDLHMDVTSSDTDDELLTEHLRSSPSSHSEQLHTAPSTHTESESGGKERLRKQILKRNPHVRSTKAKSKTDKLTPEEERRRAVRRQRNKEAAQRCRSRRTALTDRLFKEFQDLECKNTSLKYQVRQLEKEQAQLETILQSHVMKCRLKGRDGSPNLQTS